jgi:CheY-like chemotaxis protein
MCTGNSERIDQDELAAAGVHVLLQKPVEPDVLYGLLKTHLNS